MKKIIFFILTLFSISCSSESGNYINEDSKTYSADGVEKVYISTSSGDVVVEKWNSNNIEIKTIKRSYFQMNLNEVDTKISKGKKFKIESEYKNEINKINTYIKYKIYIPENIEVEIKTDTGDIDVMNVTFIDEITTNSGDIDVDVINMKENVKIETKDGDIKAKIKEGIYKKIETNTVFGDVKLDGISRKSSGKYNIELKTNSGDIIVH